MVMKLLQDGNTTGSCSVHLSGDHDSCDVLYHETNLTALPGIMASGWRILPGHRQHYRKGNHPVAFANKFPGSTREKYENTVAVISENHGTKHVSVQLQVVGIKGKTIPSLMDMCMQSPHFQVICVEFRVKAVRRMGIFAEHLSSLSLQYWANVDNTRNSGISYCITTKCFVYFINIYLNF